MAQNYNDVPSSQTLTSSRALLLDRDEAVRSAFSGTSGPATPVIGQFWFDTSVNPGRLYQCTAISPSTVWREIPFGNPVAVAQGGTGATTAAQARTNLGIGTLGSKDANAVDVDITQTSTGFLKVAAGTDAQRPVSPANGMIRYSTTQSLLEGYVNGQWQPVGSTTYNNMLVQRFNGVGGAGNQNLSLSSNPGSLNNVDVYINGVYQQKDQLSLAGTTLTVPAAPVGTNNIEVVYGVPLSIGVPADTSVTTAKLADGAVSTAKMAATGVAPGSYGSSTQVPVITIDASGRVTAVTNTSLSSAGQLKTEVFVPMLATGSASSGTLTTSSETGTPLQNGIYARFALGAFAGTASVTGTSMNVTAATAGVLDVGSVVTFPAFAGTATNSGTTLTVATATAGGLQVGSTINTACSITASRSGSTMTVTAVASGGIHVGMTITGMGTVTAFGTGTGGNGTYTMNASGTVSSGSRTGSGTATIQSLGTGAGGAGTYTIDRSYTAISYNVTADAVTKSITALGTGNGSTGTYTVTPTGNVASGAVTGSTSGEFQITGGSAGSWTFTPARTFPSQTVNPNRFSYTVPAGVTRLRAVVNGAGGGGGGSSGGCASPGGEAGGQGGFVYGEYTVTPGSTLAMTIGLGGTGGNTSNSPAGTGNGTAGGTSSLASLATATGGTGGIYQNAGASASGTGSGGAGSLKTAGTGDHWSRNGSVSTNVTPLIASVTNAAASGGQGGSNSQNAGGGGSGAIVLEYIG